MEAALSTNMPPPQPALLATAVMPEKVALVVLCMAMAPLVPLLPVKLVLLTCNMWHDPLDRCTEYTIKYDNNKHSRKRL